MLAVTRAGENDIRWNQWIRGKMRTVRYYDTYLLQTSFRLYQFYKRHVSCFISFNTTIIHRRESFSFHAIDSIDSCFVTTWSAPSFFALSPLYSSISVSSFFPAFSFFFFFFFFLSVEKSNLSLHVTYIRSYNKFLYEPPEPPGAMNFLVYLAITSAFHADKNPVVLDRERMRFIFFFLN